MSHDEKFLLFEDLCMRLPYGVMCSVPFDKNIMELHAIRGNGIPLCNTLLTFDTTNVVCECYLSEVKPYLRPMESMTAIEDMEYCEIKGKDEVEQMTLEMKYLLSHHFDINGLIPKGLALETPNGMYPDQLSFEVRDTEGFTEGLVGIDRLDRIIELLRSVNKVTEKQIAELEYMFKRGLADEFGVKGKELEEKKKALENGRADLEYLLARREAYVLRRQKRNE